MGSILKILVLVLACLGVCGMSGCDDEKKTICCRCTCYAKNTPEGEATETKTISTQNSCDDACRSFCEWNDDFSGYEMSNATPVDCPANLSSISPY
jgi:hypothetical protein